jgi:HEAT repeat protein
MDSFQGRPAELWVQLLRDPNPKRRMQATEALQHIGAKAIKPLIRLYVHGHTAERRSVLLCLGKMGPDALEALPVVKKALSDPHLELRRAARKAFERIDPDTAIQSASLWRKLRYWCSRWTRSASVAK